MFNMLKEYGDCDDQGSDGKKKPATSFFRSFKERLSKGMLTIDFLEEMFNMKCYNCDRALTILCKYRCEPESTHNGNTVVSLRELKQVHTVTQMV